MSAELGRGSYGTVVKRNGVAVKSFTRLPYLIQEIIALSYLNDCERVVKLKGFDLSKMELNMELYDGCLRDWLKTHRLDENLRNSILKQLLLALVELHDRDLIHGDLKPTNILFRNNKDGLYLVLGDCGFVSISKYAKTEQTAAIYRDPTVSKEPAHDIFSLGVICVELWGNYRFSADERDYDTIASKVEAHISNSTMRKHILMMLKEHHHKRPTARQLLKSIFGIEPPVWPGLSSFKIKTIEDFTQIEQETKKIIIEYAEELNINRTGKLYGALISTYKTKNITEHKLYTYAGLVITASLFGHCNFTLKSFKVSERQLLKAIEELIKTDLFISVLLSRSK